MATDPSAIVAQMLGQGLTAGQNATSAYQDAQQAQQQKVSNDQAIAENGIKLQTLQQQTANDAGFQSAWADVQKAPTPDNIANILVQYPLHGQAVKDFWALKEPEVRASHINAIAPVYSLLDSGKTDKAVTSLQQLRDAAAKSGTTDADYGDLNGEIAALQSGDKDSINAVKTTLLMHLVAADPEGKYADSFAKAQKALSGGDPYTLGATRFDGKNRVVAQGAPKPMEAFHYTLKDGAGNEHEYIYDPSAGRALPPGAVPVPGASAASALAPDGKLDPQAFYKQFVLPHEGGYAPHDANGAPVNHGINQSANPGVDVKNLTADDAAGIFATKYFPASANLPPALAAVNADTSFINPRRAAQFLQASGGDVGKYMIMRQSWMNSLVQNQPQTYAKYAKAWGTRNADLAAYAQNLAGGSAAFGGAPASAGMSTAPLGGSRQIDPNPVNNTPSTDVPGNPNLTGPDYLADLKRSNPSLGNRAQAILDTRAPFPTAVGKRNPVNEQLAAAVSQIDPSFDQAAWKRRSDTIKAYSPAGDQGKSLISAATIINHLYDMAQASQNLPDHTFKFMNKVANAVSGETNDPSLIAYNEGRKFNSTEIPKFLTGKAPAQGEIQQNYDSYDPALGASGIKKAISTDLDYISGRFGPLLDAYRTQTGKDFDLDRLVPGAALSTKLAALENWQAGGKLAVPSKTLGTAPAKPTPTAPPAPAIALLKSNPRLAQAFDQKYGLGAAARVLGR